MVIVSGHIGEVLTSSLFIFILHYYVTLERESVMEERLDVNVDLSFSLYYFLADILTGRNLGEVDH